MYLPRGDLSGLRFAPCRRIATICGATTSHCGYTTRARGSRTCPAGEVTITYRHGHEVGEQACTHPVHRQHLSPGTTSASASRTTSAAVAWYTEKLDFRVLQEWPYGDMRLAYLSLAADDGFHLELLAGPIEHSRPVLDDLAPEPHLRRLPALLPASGQRRQGPRRTCRPGRRRAGRTIRDRGHQPPARILPRPVGQHHRNCPKPCPAPGPNRRRDRRPAKHLQLGPCRSEPGGHHRPGLRGRPGLLSARAWGRAIQALASRARICSAGCSGGRAASRATSTPPPRVMVGQCSAIVTAAWRSSALTTA